MKAETSSIKITASLVLEQYLACKRHSINMLNEYIYNV